MPGLLARSVMPTQKVQTENAKKYTAETAHSWWLDAKVTRQVAGRSIINTFPSIWKLATSCGQQRLARDAKSCGGDVHKAYLRVSEWIIIWWSRLYRHSTPRFVCIQYVVALVVI